MGHEPDDLPADFVRHKSPSWIKHGPGHYPWDEWEKRAIAAGLSKDLANLGRAIYRESYQHNWDENLKEECGWDDDGADLLHRLLTDAETVRERLTHLLETDGGAYSPDD